MTPTRADKAAATTVFTVGHGTRSPDELVAVLDSVSIQVLCDVRRFPGSRRHPHFARDSLQRALPRSGVDYQWWGEGLGGRRSGDDGSRHRALRNKSFRAYADFMDTDAFRSALGELERLARFHRTAIMCAETLWWRCHRRHIADALTLDGFEVVHLLDATSRQTHPLHPSLRRDSNGKPVYDVAANRRLLE